MSGKCCTFGGMKRLVGFYIPIDLVTDRLHYRAATPRVWTTSETLVNNYDVD